MLTRIAFENFRGFKERTEIDDLKRITLISGRNNAGKTSVLEGIYLYMMQADVRPFFQISTYRGMPYFPPEVPRFLAIPTYIWEPLFNDMDPSKTIRISGSLDDNDGEMTLIKDEQTTPPEDPHRTPEMVQEAAMSLKNEYSLHYSFRSDEFNASGNMFARTAGMSYVGSRYPDIEISTRPLYINSYIINTDNARAAEWFSKISLADDKENVIKAIRIIESSITDLQVITQNKIVLLYTKAQSRMMPLKLAGDGMNIMAYIIMAILANPGAVILIDEIENGFHYTTYQKLWAAIAHAARTAKCQVIATTHNYECIRAAAEAATTHEFVDDIAYYRLNRNKNDEVKVTRFDHETLATSMEFSMEVR